MRKTFASLLCLTAILLIACLPIAGCAATQDEQGRCLYLDIPYNTITPDGTDQILLDTYGEIRYTEYGHYLIADFGYDFFFAVNYNESLVGAGRIILSKPDEERATGDAFITMYEKDVLQFVDMEAQLIERYGEPNFRFFFTRAGNYSMDGMTRFMFPSGVWNTVKMLDVLTKDEYLEAYSCWSNITLRLWINPRTDDPRGNYSRLTLAFYDKFYPKESPAEIIDYPPAVD